jgi:GNAT superfamily N-acetyltransferase
VSTGETPRIGVALCTYNGAQYLAAQLDSILAQTVPVEEIVVGDDGSTDTTLAVLEDYRGRAAARGIHMEVVQHARNLGYVLNFSDALQRCRADVIFLCDQDDIWHPTRVDSFMRRFDADPALMLLHGDARLVNGAGEPLGSTLLEILRVHPAELALERSGWVLDAILLRNFITGATCALRRTLLADGLPVPPRWSHDEWLAVIASLQGGLDVVHSCTIDYRQHGGNQIGASRRSLFARLSDFLRTEAEGRPRTAERLRILKPWLNERGQSFAPGQLSALAAVAWRLAWSRMQLYRRSQVGWKWIAGDVPWLLARVVSICLAGGGWAGAAAACRGAWAGIWEREST